MPLHLRKNAGVPDWESLQRAMSGSPTGSQMAVQTRNMPKRGGELLDGGSLYWVARKVIVARQTILDLTEGVRGDGVRCAVLVLDGTLVRTRPQPCGWFQGWRYMEADKAPLDMDTDEGGAVDEAMPEEMRRALREAGLL